jgi:Flp pilus assembly protein TadG
MSLLAAQRAGGARRAAAAVEFALVAPIMFAVVLGSIEFGRVMMSLNTLSNAARNGARVGVIPGNTNTNVQTAVNNLLDGAGIDHTKASTTVLVNGSQADVSSGTNGDSITVTVSISANNVSWLAKPWFLGSNPTLSQTAVMRHE